MAKVNSLLAQRLKSATEKLSKMTNLVERSSSGNLSSFSGVFRVTPLNEKENEALSSLLEQYRNETQEIQEDLFQLSTLTAEVKAINNQAIILHGERIKKAQEILKSYRDGAFSAWLIATYGNRQTPYNFLQYYELYKALPEHLHAKIDEMPRQAVYSLASRAGDAAQKEEIVKNYKGQPKLELLKLIRETFPLADNDRRAQNLGEVALSQLRRLYSQLSSTSFVPHPKQKKELLQVLKELKMHIEQKALLANATVGVAEPLCPEKSMILKPFTRGSQAATVTSTTPLPSGLAEEKGCKWPQKGDFNGQMSSAIPSITIQIASEQE